MITGSRANACLITLRTGVVLDEDAVGLVGNHAYAVLEVIEFKGLKMLLIKNPWGHFRWSGKYSYGDSIWTPELKQALGYDNFQQDKGVFWMDLESVLTWFEGIDLNWSPDLLAHRKSFFDYWSADQMQIDSNSSLKNNP